MDKETRRISASVGFIVAAIIILIFVVLLLYYRMFHKSEVVYESERFNVVQRFADRDEAAIILASINERTRKLMKIMSSRSEKAAKNIMRYRPDTIKECDPIWSLGHKAFTTSDGNISICLRRRDESFYEDGTIWFVFLHELAHVATIHRIRDADHHPAEFWENFAFILRIAKDAGLYEPVNYRLTPIEYCDIRIDNNPYYA